MIAFVLALIFDFILSGSKHQYSGWESTQIGMAPVKVTVLAVAINVRDGIRTSSPALIPRATRAR